MRAIGKSVQLILVCMSLSAIWLPRSIWCGEQTGSESGKLTASDGAAEDYFGVAVAVSGDVALVGAAGDDDDGDLSGSAYIFRYDGLDWVEEQKLTASDADENDYFGRAVSVSGEVAIVGAYRDDENGAYSGSAYVFRYDGLEWIEEQKLTASDGTTEDYFGMVVSVSGDVALVSAYGDDDGASFYGSAYVFRYDGEEWVEEQKLTISDGAADDFFASTVSVSGDVAVVGAWGDGEHGAYSGSVYVFRYDGLEWIEEQKLTASDAESNDEFGSVVSVSEGVIIASALADNDYSGSAYLFRYDGREWVEEQKLTASDGPAFHEFGFSVSLSGDAALVGAFFNDDNGIYSGSAYLYRYDGVDWVEARKLNATDGAAEDWLGFSVSLSEDVALVGACFDDDNGDNSCSAYLFLLPPDCNQNFVDDTIDITDGASADCNLNSIPDECETGSNISTGALGASDPGDGDLFGSAVAIDGEFMVVGAPGDDEAASDAGAAYVFSSDAGRWLEPQKLLPKEAEADDEFGYAVAISGDVIVVGVRLDDTATSNTGSVYVYRLASGTWVQEEILTATFSTAADQLGTSVDIDGDVIVAGAPLDDTAASNAGAVAVWRHDGDSWTEDAAIYSSDGAAADQFGTAVAVSGYWIVAGAPNDDDDGSTSGSAYFYAYDGDSWTSQEKVTGSDGSALDLFGGAVAIDGNAALIGAKSEDSGGSDRGAAYQFRFVDGGWIEEQKIVAADSSDGDAFGSAVSLNGDSGVIGAVGANAEAGSIYVFGCDGNAWTQQLRFVGSAASDGDNFGQAVAISGFNIAGGAPKNESAASVDTGTVYSYATLDCDGNGTPDSCDIEADPTIDTDGNGIIDGCESKIAPCSGDDVSEVPPFGWGPPRFKRGDCDGNGTVSAIADVLYLLRYGFTGGAAPPCMDAADVNGNDEVSAIIDAVSLLDYGFTGGNAPPAPGADACGPDADDDTLDCATPPVCP